MRRRHSHPESRGQGWVRGKQWVLQQKGMFQDTSAWMDHPSESLLGINCMDLRKGAGGGAGNWTAQPHTLFTLPHKEVPPWFLSRCSPGRDTWGRFFHSPRVRRKPWAHSQEKHWIQHCYIQFERVHRLWENVHWPNEAWLEPRLGLNIPSSPPSANSSKLQHIGSCLWVFLAGFVQCSPLSLVSWIHVKFLEFLLSSHLCQFQKLIYK